VLCFGIASGGFSTPVGAIQLRVAEVAFKGGLVSSFSASLLLGRFFPNPKSYFFGEEKS
jgi:hypothetical protein